jgi:hypothetical protein
MAHEANVSTSRKKRNVKRRAKSAETLDGTNALWLLLATSQGASAALVL